MRRELAHFAKLDPRFAHRLTLNSVEAIAKFLHQNGAPKTCHVLSESDSIDDTELELDAVLKQIVGQGIGTLLSCIPGKLGYYEGEEPGERYILKRA